MKKHSAMAGLPPGSLVLVGEQRVDRPSISVIDYNEESFQERADVSVEECAVYPDSPTVSWVNMLMHLTKVPSNRSMFAGICT